MFDHFAQTGILPCKGLLPTTEIWSKRNSSPCITCEFTHYWGIVKGISCPFLNFGKVLLTIIIAYVAALSWGKCIVGTPAHITLSPSWVSAGSSALLIFSTVSGMLGLLNEKLTSKMSGMLTSLLGPHKISNSWKGLTSKNVQQTDLSWVRKE